LRKRLAAQEETIQQLKAMVQQLADGKLQTSQAGDPAKFQTVSGSTADQARAVPAILNLSTAPLNADGSFNQQQNLAEKKPNPPSSPAGWNGEHFFLRSPDGQFTLLPQGYLNTNYSFFSGDGTPPNTFRISRARFGFIGTYGSKVDYAFLFDAAATNGIAIRDMYVNAKPVPQFQIQAGQFKEPFSQEVGTGDTNVEFLERSLVTVLYPSATGTFRAPGTAVHGDLHGGAIQYWAGVFNGKGIIANNTTNELEVVGRLRFSPWKNRKDSLLKGFSIGGSVAHSRSNGLSNELSFSGTTNDSAFVWFPQFRINGGIERYNGEFLWLTGVWGLRGEYTQILQKRDGVGSEAVGGIGFQSLPGVVGKGGYITLTRLITGEREPENAIPKVAHPVIGPATPGVEGSSTPGMGAWQVKFRYSWIEGKAGGQTFASPFTPSSVPAFSRHTDQFTFGVNWYLNYWMLVKLDLNYDRLHDPSVGGVLPQNFYVATQGLQFRF
jgi:phosphate-selective porin